MDTKREDRRPENDQRDLFFGIISLKQLAWSEHNARIVDVGEDGLRIETSEHIEPGYVWFRQRIKGNRGGFLEWSVPSGDGYWARIRFAPLSWNVEQYVQERARRSLAHIPLHDPAETIAPHGELLTDRMQDSDR